MNEQIPSSCDVVTVRELAYRADGDFEVTLLWRPRRDDLVVTVVERATLTAFEIPVGNKPPLEVFYHPYAYAPLPAAA